MICLYKYICKSFGKSETHLFSVSSNPSYWYYFSPLNRNVRAPTLNSLDLRHLNSTAHAYVRMCVLHALSKNCSQVQVLAVVLLGFFFSFISFSLRLCGSRSKNNGFAPLPVGSVAKSSTAKVTFPFRKRRLKGSKLGKKSVICKGQFSTANDPPTPKEHHAAGI